MYSQALQNIGGPIRNGGGSTRTKASSKTLWWSVGQHPLVNAVSKPRFPDLEQSNARQKACSFFATHRFEEYGLWRCTQCRGQLETKILKCFWPRLQKPASCASRSSNSCPVIGLDPEWMPGVVTIQICYPITGGAPRGLQSVTVSQVPPSWAAESLMRAHASGQSFYFILILKSLFPKCSVRIRQESKLSNCLTLMFHETCL